MFQREIMNLSVYYYYFKNTLFYDKFVRIFIRNTYLLIIIYELRC